MTALFLRVSLSPRRRVKRIFSHAPTRPCPHAQLSTLHALHFLALLPPETPYLMIVHHTHSLHESIANGAAGKSKAPPFHVLGHGVAFGGGSGKVINVLVPVHLGLTAHKTPEIV